MMVSTSGLHSSRRKTLLPEASRLAGSMKMRSGRKVPMIPEMLPLPAFMDDIVMFLAFRMGKLCLAAAARLWSISL